MTDNSHICACDSQTQTKTNTQPCGLYALWILLTVMPTSFSVLMFPYFLFRTSAFSTLPPNFNHTNLNVGLSPFSAGLIDPAITC